MRELPIRYLSPDHAVKIRIPSIVILGRWRSICLWVIAAGVIFIPLLVSEGGEDMFRYPKELLLRAEGVVAAAVFLLAAVSGGVRTRKSRDHGIAITLSVVSVIWAAIAAFFSVHFDLSLASVWRVATCALVFVLTFTIADALSLRAVYAVVVTGLINAALTIAQRLNIYNPFQLTNTLTPNQQTTALLGNPNDIGAFLVCPLLICMVLLTKRGKSAIIAGVALFIIGLAILLAASLTAIIATVAGLLTFSLQKRNRSRLVVTAGVSIALVVLAAAVPPLRARFERAVYFAGIGNLDFLLSGRLTAYSAAWKMVKRHPIVGVGPGCFASEYLRYGQATSSSILDAYEPSRAGEAVNFGEAHNDHLQIMAEAGLPAYGILLSFMIYLGWPAAALADDSDRRSFARRFMPAAAVAVAILAFAQFPLQLASTSITYCFCAGLCVAWRSNEDSR